MRNRKFLDTVGSFLGVSLGLSVITGLALLVVGYFNNFNYIVDSDFSDVSGREVVSVIGVFIPPVGAVNGAIYIFEEEKNESEED